MATQHPPHALSTHSLVALLLADQRQRWGHGEQVVVEAYLVQHPTLQADTLALVDLIRGELALRTENGEQPRLEEFEQRFPSCAAQIQALFASAAGRGDSTVISGDQAPTTRADPVRPRSPDRPAQRSESSPLLRLLGPARQKEVLQDLLPHYPDELALANELLRRGWLTSFQQQRLAAGRGDELLLGPYVLLELLGKGGMGQVYKARHGPLDRLVAFKIIRKEFVEQEQALARFTREARAVARLAHPNIVTLYDAGVVNGTPFLAMEYLEGSDLARLVAREGPLSVQRACDYLRQAALGLQHAGERGLIHRDVKPANLFLTVQGALIKILDLGLARLHEVDNADGILTQAGQILGTPDYLAPEQLTDARSVDGRADLYSLGCTACYLLTGQPPFPGSLVWGKFLKHQQEEPQLLQRPPDDLPPALIAILRRLLAKRPEDRFQTPGEVVAALAPFCHPASAALAEIVPFATPVLPTTVPVAPAPQPAPTAFWKIPVVRALVLASLAAALILATVHFWPPNPDGATEPERSDKPGRTSAEPVAKGTSPKINKHSARPEGQPVTYVAGSVRFLRYLVRQGAQDHEAHHGGVESVAFCPDGRHAISGGIDGALRLWDLTTGAEVARFGKITHAEQIAVSPDGRLILAGGHDGSLRVWDYQSGQKKWDLPGYADGVGAVAFAPKARLAVFGGKSPADPSLRLWDQAEGKKLYHFPGYREPIYALAFSPDGTRLAAAGGGYWQGDKWVGSDFAIRIWDVADRTEYKSLQGHTDSVGALAFTPDGRYLLSGGRDETLRLWEVSSGRELRQHKAHESGVRSVAIAPGGRVALSGGTDCQVRLWRLPLSADGVFLDRPLEEICTLARSSSGTAQPAHAKDVMSVAIAPDGRRALTAGRDGTLQLWQLAE